MIATALTPLFNKPVDQYLVNSYSLVDDKIPAWL